MSKVPSTRRYSARAAPWRGRTILSWNSRHTQMKSDDCSNVRRFRSWRCGSDPTSLRHERSARMSHSRIDKLIGPAARLEIAELDEFRLLVLRRTDLSKRTGGPPLRFYSHQRLSRVCPTLVGRQKDMDGMGSGRFPQG